MSNPYDLVGKQIDQFRLDQFIAKGAMGMVFEAFDTILARTVALKLISKKIDETLTVAEATIREEALKRLIQEAKAAGRLAHPNIVTVHSYGETDEFQYICMEFVRGKTLAQLLSERNNLETEEAIIIFEQILTALEAAGQEHIVHRDIKPSNIMITGDMRVKVMDFGIAKLPSFSMTTVGTILGTPYYMSPEQISGQKVDIRSDIFSAGAVFYQALTGGRPFEADSTATLTYQIINVEPVPPNVLNRHISTSLANIITKALAKDPEKRYQTPAEMLEDLKTAFSTTVVLKGPVPAEKTIVQAAEIEQREPEPIPHPKTVQEPRVESPAPLPVVSPAKIVPPQVTKKGANLRTLALGVILLLVVGGGAAMISRTWTATPRYSAPPPVNETSQRTPPSSDLQRSTTLPETVQPVPAPSVPAVPQTTPATPAPSDTSAPPTIPAPSMSTATVAPPPPPPPPKTTAAPSTGTPKVEGRYIVRGTNPNGTRYRGAAVINRSGDQYVMSWNIANQSFSGSGTLSGKTLTIHWSGTGNAGGVVTYTVQPNGMLKGKWAKGSGTEILTPTQ